MLGRGGVQTGCCELGRGAARSRPQFREALPRASAPHRAAAAVPRPGPPEPPLLPHTWEGSRGGGDAWRLRTPGRGAARRVGPRAAEPSPAPGARAPLPPTANTCAGAGGAGRRSAPPRCTYSRPPRPAPPAATNPRPLPASPPLSPPCLRRLRRQRRFRSGLERWLPAIPGNPM